MTMNKNLPSFALCVLFAFLLTLPVSAQAPPDYDPGVVVVQFEPEVAYKTGLRTGLQEFDQKASRYGVHAIERMFPFLDYAEPTPETAENIAKLRRTYSVRYSVPAQPERVAEELELAAGVTYAEPALLNRDAGYSRRDAPNDIRYSLQEKALELARVPAAWEIVKGEDGTPSVVIAVVDSGADWEHEDLLGNVWVNEDEVPGNGLDDDENGFIDDVHGVFFGNGDDLNNDPGDAPSTTLEHGTAVAGIAGAVTDNFLGISGVAWNAKIMHVNANAEGSGRRINYGYQGIVYAAMNGADIINASWGAYGPLSGTPAHISEAIELATDMGALIVAAAGNDGKDMSTHLPSSHPLVLAAGWSGGFLTPGITRQYRSNYGPTVLFAPGGDLWSTFPEGQYDKISGTSIAAPFISAVAALMKTREPDLDPRALRNHLLVSSRYMGDYVDHNEETRIIMAEDLARGFIDAEASVTPGPRVSGWRWTDSGGDDEISSGEEVTITATVVNYSEDSDESVAVLVPERDYSFLSIIEGERVVRPLGRNDSVEVSLRFKVAEDAPVNRSPRFHIRLTHEGFHHKYEGISVFVNLDVDAQNRAYQAILDSGIEISRIRTFGPWITGMYLLGDLARPLTEIGMFPHLRKVAFYSPSRLPTPVPIEIELLENLVFLEIRYGSGFDIFPPGLKKMTVLQHLELWDNNFGSLPRSFLETDLRYLRSPDICLPDDSEFREWSKKVKIIFRGNWLHPFCSAQFGERVRDQSFKAGGVISPVTLPGAPGKLNYWRTGPGSYQTASPPIVYTLHPALPEGLTFNAATRTISGTPAFASAPVTYTYTATDANLAIDTLTFSIEVLARIPTSTQRTALPESFAFHGNYPNPFAEATHLSFDLPWAARVGVEVLDVTGRRVHVQSPADLSSGWNQSIALRLALPAGVYLYRLTADTPEGLQVRSGRFVKVR
ncbi:MAG: S8 family serine peptidase [Rhodothermaceae bacterium]|nr:S8 family serine peptidase [Rhodothermaceae bacterium]